jgi:hypothetical protein
MTKRGRASGSEGKASVAEEMVSGAETAVSVAEEETVSDLKERENSNVTSYCLLRNLLTGCGIQERVLHTTYAVVR